MTASTKSAGTAAGTPRLAGRRDVLPAPSVSCGVALVVGSPMDTAAGTLRLAGRRDVLPAPSVSGGGALVVGSPMARGLDT